MNRWFRFYSEVVDDPKVQRLPAEMFRAWVNLLCLASANGGFLPSANDIAYKLRITGARVDTIIDEMVAQELMDVCDDGTICPHNWNGRQFKSDHDETSSERQQRYRQRKRNALRNGTSNALRNGRTSRDVTRTDTETDTEPERTGTGKGPLGRESVVEGQGVVPLRRGGA